jgi:galactokinase
MSASTAETGVIQAIGLGAGASAEAARLLNAARSRLGDAPAHGWWVPGRVEVLGKHTDYAGGRVLNCATDVGLVALARPRRDALVRVLSRDQEVLVPLASDAVAAPGMGTYIAAVTRRLARHFPGLERGVDLAIAANLPAAAGMSSSSALVIAVHSAVAAVNRLEQRDDYRAGIASDDDLVPYLGCHENGAGFRQFAGDAGVGTSGGSQDHAAILLSRAGLLNHWSFNPFHRVGSVAWPDDLQLVVAVSGVLAEKSAAARGDFNRVAGRALAARDLWNAASGRSDPSLGAAFAAVGSDAVLAAIADEDLRRRAEQTARESEDIVPGAVAALGRGDLARFGALTACSQAMAETHLLNQIPETIALVRIALDHGAVAASAFGAGFGGAVWAAFRRGRPTDGWLSEYRQRFPQHAAGARLQAITPGPGVTALGPLP